MQILFDTHALLWFLTDSPNLPQDLKNRLTGTDVRLFFSSVSILEIAIKHSLKPLAMPCVPEEVRATAEASGISELVFASSHAQLVGTLPWIHRDPFDRMLIAQAMAEHMQLLSHDDTVMQYGEVILPF